MIVNRVERTVEHRAGLAEILAYFGPDTVWSPHLPKRTVSTFALAPVPLFPAGGGAAAKAVDAASSTADARTNANLLFAWRRIFCPDIAMRC